MPCFHPIPAWRTADRTVAFKEPPNATGALQLPCGTCIGCRTRRAQGIALRCHLELQQHQQACWTTLTYSDQNVPPTLQKRDYQLWLKRLRKADRVRRQLGHIRHFTAGEYGEHRHRPHFHSILFGVPSTFGTEIEVAWGLGYTRTYDITPAAIAYVAGYTSKKIGYREPTLHRRVAEGTPNAIERVNPHTGEVYWTVTAYQPPFQEWSLGLGANAKKHTASWRAYAIHNGYKIPVPRYLHDAWTEQATQQEIEQLEYDQYLLTKESQTSQYTKQAQEQIATARHKQATHDRHYG